MQFLPVEFSLLTSQRLFPLRCEPGATQQWPLWAQWSWVPFPDTGYLCVLWVSGNETLERNREQISACVVWGSKAPCAFATPGIKAGYFAVILGGFPHFLCCLPAANPSSRLQSSANHSVFKQWRQGQKRDVATQDSRCTWGMLLILYVVINLLLSFSLQRLGCSILLMWIFSVLDFHSGFGFKIDLKFITCLTFCIWCLWTSIFVEEA